MKKILLLILSISVLAGCDMFKTTAPAESAKPTESMEKISAEAPVVTDEVVSYIDISPSEAKQMIDTKPELMVIDVSPKYADGHLPRAINYYVGDGTLDKAIPTLDPLKEYLVYCHVDSASISGAQKLIDAGFKKVYRMEGNYKAWVDAGYPIEK